MTHIRCGSRQRDCSTRETARSVRASVWARAPSTPSSRSWTARRQHELEATSTSDQVLDEEDAQRDTQLPHAYPQAEQLALSITAGKPTVYAKVEALISWIGSHTRYSTDIPPLPAGADAVNEFLFGNRVGYCEQISTALTVMLRTLGIPAREAAGYVPGSLRPDHRPLRHPGE